MVFLLYYAFNVTHDHAVYNYAKWSVNSVVGSFFRLLGSMHRFPSNLCKVFVNYVACKDIRRSIHVFVATRYYARTSIIYVLREYFCQPCRDVVMLVVFKVFCQLCGKESFLWSMYMHGFWVSSMQVSLLTTQYAGFFVNNVVCKVLYLLRHSKGFCQLRIMQVSISVVCNIFSCS